jgi:hemoglobin-like flavoprotein
MTTNQIQIVKKTWSIVAKLDPSVAGTLFYTRLFAGRPGIKELFKSSIEEQSAKLISMINYAVSKLDKPAVMLSDVAKWQNVTCNMVCSPVTIYWSAML